MAERTRISEGYWKANTIFNHTEREGFIAIKPIKSDVQKYDIIFLGYPIWFGTYAPPIASLIENAHFEG